ncbi:Uncharacterised protein [Mycobacteroides abscessus subsp. abscessus]|nr:Uncharacterised protein [Mycobacteroides abscessus subsp. abscessus]
MSSGVQSAAAGAARSFAQPRGVKRPAHAGVWPVASHLTANNRPCSSTGPNLDRLTVLVSVEWRAAPPLLGGPWPARSCGAFSVGDKELKETGSPEIDPLRGWGDRIGETGSHKPFSSRELSTTGIGGCSAHTEAQPRERSPIRQDANRSALVRWRPRRTSVAHPNAFRTRLARCTTRGCSPLTVASVSLVGRQCRPVRPSANNARASATRTSFSKVMRSHLPSAPSAHNCLYRAAYAAGTAIRAQCCAPFQRGTPA